MSPGTGGDSGGGRGGGREAAVTQAFVAIANSLVDGVEAVELYASLTSDCARLLDVESVGLLLADPSGVLHLMAASSERARELELFQLQREEGPCLDCFRSGAPVRVPDVREQLERWPQFAAAAAAAGFVSVHALPMRLRETVLGVLGMFGTSTGTLTAEDLALAQALAHVASVALVAERAAADKATINDQLQRALDSRVVIEQAKGVLAQLGEMGIDTAFAVLRRYARDHNVPISGLAAQLVSRQILAADVLAHVANRPQPGRLRRGTDGNGRG